MAGWKTFSKRLAGQVRRGLVASGWPREAAGATAIDAADAVADPSEARALALAATGRLGEADRIAPADSLGGPANRRLAEAGAPFSPIWALPRLGPRTDAYSAALLLAAGRPDDAAAVWAELAQPLRPLDVFAFESALAASRGDHRLARERLNRALETVGMRGVIGASDAPMSIAGMDAAPVAPGGDSRLVTVIICVRNMVATAPAALDSTLAQSHRALEVIVVDDASKDGTRRELLRIAARDRRVRLIDTGRHVGLFAARNLGLRTARGDFVTFHDADDWMHPDRVAASLAALDDAPRALGAVFRLLRLDDRGRICAPRIWPLPRRANCSVMLRRAPAMERIGPFEEMRVGADEEYLGRIVRLDGASALAKRREIVIVARQSGQSLTGDAATGVASPAGSALRARYRDCWTARHAGGAGSCEDPASCRCGNRLVPPAAEASAA